MSSRYKVLDPDEGLDYISDWTNFLDDAGSPADTISSSDWDIVPEDASPVIPTLSTESFSASTATVFVSDAVLGALYRLSNTIVTAQGRTGKRSITLRCEHR